MGNLLFLARKHRALEDAAATKMQAAWRGTRGRAAAVRARQELEERCALRIQCRWRCRQGQMAMFLLRKAKQDRDREQTIAATKIQCIYRSRRARKVNGETVVIYLSS